MSVLKIQPCKSNSGHFWAGYMGSDDYLRCSWCGQVVHYSQLTKKEIKNE